MVFDFNKYGTLTVMHCKTESEAISFCNVLHDLGEKWCNGSSYKNDSHWRSYKQRTCYCFRNGCYGHLKYFEDNKYEILKWSDFYLDSQINLYSKILAETQEK